MERNLYPDFAGLQAIKAEHAAQISKFQEWARRGYGDFHHNHYDWWAFPIDEPSSKGYRYVVKKGDIEELKKDREFMARYIQGLELLCASWGWDLNNARRLSNVNQHQRWQVSWQRNLIFHLFFAFFFSFRLILEKNSVILLLAMAYSALESCIFVSSVRLRS